MSKRLDSIKKAIRSQLHNVPDEIQLLGDPGRPNSWTFKLIYSDSSKQVIKVIKPKSAYEEEAKAEEEALERLKGRTDINAIQYSTKGKLLVDGKELPYFIFPFIEGDDLNEFLRRMKIFSEEEALFFLDELITTILKLAEIGIIHQDIKPGNIKVTNDGKFLLIDLGIARFIEHKYKLLKQRGPLRYLSPEQVALGQKSTPSNQRKMTFLSDIYSVAVVTFELLTGKDFDSLWKIDERHKVSQALRVGSILKIQNQELKTKLIHYLENSISKRLELLYRKEGSRLNFLAKKKLKLPSFWNLHYSTTGQDLLVNYAKDNPNLKGGAVFLSEYIKSVENDKNRIKHLRRMKWKIIVDPSTYKLAFHECHFAKLKDIFNYESPLSKKSFLNSQFKKKFIEKAIEWQKKFNPDFYISPHFFIEDAEDEYLDITFDLYEETKKLYSSLFSKNSLLCGIAISQDLLCDEQRLRNVIDQLVIYSEADGYYIRPELIKTNNSPCSNENYLKNLLLISKLLTISKSILISQVDQSCLGLLAHSSLSIAINPEVSIRKADIKNKLTKKGRKGGPKKEFRIIKYYVPLLLNDLDISRELGTKDFQKSKSALNIKCSCRYCREMVFPHKDSGEIRDKRRLHFLHSFQNQISEINSSDKREKKLEQFINQAEKFYQQFELEGIKFSEESGGGFLSTWKTVFLSI